MLTEEQAELRYVRRWTPEVIDKAPGRIPQTLWVKHDFLYANALMCTVVLFIFQIKPIL